MDYPLLQQAHFGREIASAFFPQKRHDLTFQIISWTHRMEPCHWPCETCLFIYLFISFSLHGTVERGPIEMGAAWIRFLWVCLFIFFSPSRCARVHYASEEPNTTDMNEWVSDTFSPSTAPTDLPFGDDLFDLLQMCGRPARESVCLAPTKWKWRGHRRGVSEVGLVVLWCSSGFTGSNSRRSKKTWCFVAALANPFYNYEAPTKTGIEIRCFLI